MSFPATGHSRLAVAGWTWEKPPGLAPVQGGFATVSAMIGIRRTSATAMPAIFVEGRKLASGDFTGDNAVGVPGGNFWLQRPVMVESRHDHEVYDLTWIGVATGQGKEMLSAKLVFPTFSSSNGVIMLESFAQNMQRRTVSLPEDEVYAGAGLLPAGAPLVNPHTSLPQRTQLLLKEYRRSYSGKAVLIASEVLPEPSCTAFDIDTDGGINLSGNGEQEVRVRQAYWWPSKVGTFGWILQSFNSNLLSSHGSAMCFDWTAEFQLVKQWDF
jgi:hypothetical protein